MNLNCWTLLCLPSPNFRHKKKIGTQRLVSMVPQSFASNAWIVLFDNRIYQLNQFKSKSFDNLYKVLVLKSSFLNTKGDNT